MEYSLKLYPARMFGSRFQNVSINGEQRYCVVTPVDSRLMFQDNKGEYYIYCKMKEMPEITPTGVSHKVVLYHRRHPDLHIKKNGQRLYGFAYIKAENSMRDKTNRADDFTAYGIVCLSDVTEDETWINPYDGKKYVRIKISKMPYLDSSQNTHEILIDPRYGAQKGTAPSVCDGKHAPYRSIGRMTQYKENAPKDYQIPQTEPPAPPVDNETEKGNNIDEQKTIEGYIF